MVTKGFWKRKTTWGGIVSMITGVSVIITTGNISDGASYIIAGILVITGRDALAKLEK